MTSSITVCNKVETSIIKKQANAFAQEIANKGDAKCDAHLCECGKIIENEKFFISHIHIMQEIKSCSASCHKLTNINKFVQFATAYYILIRSKHQYLVNNVMESFNFITAETKYTDFTQHMSEIVKLAAANKAKIDYLDKIGVKFDDPFISQADVNSKYAMASTFRGTDYSKRTAEELTILQKAIEYESNLIQTERDNRETISKKIFATPFTLRKQNNELLLSYMHWVAPMDYNKDQIETFMAIINCEGCLNLVQEVDIGAGDDNIIIGVDSFLRSNGMIGTAYYLKNNIIGCRFAFTLDEMKSFIEFLIQGCSLINK